MYKSLSILCLVIALEITSSTVVSAQLVDSLITLATGNQDTTQIKRLDPRKALLYSAVLPGLGQMYNGKYWKVPFVYGGFAITISVVNYYQNFYKQYREELYRYIATGQLPVGRTEENLRYVVDKARRERDYYVIITGVWYILQMVDAHVDAHLQEFKWNKDLKVSLNPSVQENVFTGRTTGLTLSFKF